MYNENEIRSNKIETGSAIEEFKHQIEGFKERMKLFELEAQNSKRTAKFIQNNLELYNDNNLEYRARISDDTVEFKSLMNKRLA